MIKNFIQFNENNSYKEEFLKEFEYNKNRISKKYGMFLYFLVQNVLNISSLEKLIESKGLKTKRRIVDKTAYSDIYKGNKIIGHLDSSSGFPSIELYNFKGNKKLALTISESDLIIEPIKGVHRILDWHTVEGKLHILAGGEIVLHAKPNSLSNEDVADFIKETGITDELIMKSKSM